MNQNIKASPAHPTSARRRLIRGAFAAPAVLALHTGSAMATTSPMRCMIGAATPPPSTGSNDVYNGSVWVRCQLWHQTSTGKYFMYGSDLPQALCTTATRPIQGCWHEYDMVNNCLSASFTPTTTAPANCTKSSSAPRWVAIRFDSYGKIVTVGHHTQGSVVTASCWTSFTV